MTWRLTELEKIAKEMDRSRGIWDDPLLADGCTSPVLRSSDSALVATENEIEARVEDERILRKALPTENHPSRFSMISSNTEKGDQEPRKRSSSQEGRLVSTKRRYTSKLISDGCLDHLLNLRL